jgi:putative SOS response-associated peptidase YedK
MKSGEPFAMAGIYARTVNHALKTFAILTTTTTTANEVMAPIHDRMSVIMPLGREKECLPTDRFSLRQEHFRNVVTLPRIIRQQCGRAGKYPQTTK